MNAQIKNLESIASFLIGIAQMPTSDIQSYFLKSENILSFKNSIFSLQKELNNFKKQVSGIQSQQKDQQLNLIKEKNAEFINLQNKLSESEKIISSTQLEIAELKKSISMQEAQNALLIAENLSLKNHGNNENFSLKSKTNDYYDFDELKRAKKTNNELQKTITKLKLDLEQTKAVSYKYKDLNDPEKANQEIDKLNLEIDEKESLYKNAQLTITELQQQLEETMENQNAKVRQIKNLLRSHSSKFERKIISESRAFDDKIGYINNHILEIKAKLMFNNDLRRENRFLSDQIEIAKQLLEFAMHSMANLAGVSDENVPSSYDVIENSEMLSIYLSDLQAKVVERTINEAEIKPKPSKKQQLNTTLDTMNDLMSIMTEQMQNEHEMLMSQISDDKELPSFRKTIMYQTSNSGE